MANNKLFQQQNFFKTTLSQPINSDSATIYLTSVPEKTKGFLVISQKVASIREIIYYTEVGLNYVTCPATGGRGRGGTTAQSHLADEEVVMDSVAEYHNPIIRALDGLMIGANVTFTPATANISVSAGTVVIGDSVCINVGAEELTSIGASGSNKDGNVTAGGIRYIYAQDDGDESYSLYVSNNSSESGKKRLGYAKFIDGSTSIIQYLYNDKEFSQFARGMTIMWYGHLNDTPVGWAICDGTNNTPDLRDRFIVGAGTTYALGATGGSATHTLTAAEMPIHTHPQNSHTHPQNSHGHGVSDPGHMHNIRVKSSAGTGASLAAAGNDFSAQGTYGFYENGTTGISIGGETAVNQNATATNQNAGSGSAHENRPPYYGLYFIMKL